MNGKQIELQIDRFFVDADKRRPLNKLCGEPCDDLFRQFLIEGGDAMAPTQYKRWLEKRNER